jgi:ribosomal protein S20
MHSTLKKIVATAAVAGALTVGSAGAAFAADGATSGSTGGAVAGQTARHQGIRFKAGKAAFKIVLDQLGVSKEDLRAALKGGQTISQYATSLGKDPAALADALTQAANDRIDQAVTNGKITAERAATIKSKVPARVDKFLNRTWGQHAQAGQA